MNTYRNHGVLALGGFLGKIADADEVCMKDDAICQTLKLIGRAIDGYSTANCHMF